MNKGCCFYFLFTTSVSRYVSPCDSVRDAMMLSNRVLFISGSVLCQGTVALGSCGAGMQRKEGYTPSVSCL